MDTPDAPKEELANLDPWVEGGGVHGFIGNPIASYVLVFETEEQLKRWYAFIKELKSVYPAERTIGGRVNTFLLDRLAGASQPPKKSIPKKKKREAVVTSVEPIPTPTE
jgi:hypothetical protein